MAQKEDTSWRNGLVKTRGTIATCLANVISVLANEPAWRGVLAYDEFTAQVVKLKDPPWGPNERPRGKLTGPWGDGDAARTAAWITREWEDIRPPEGLVESAVRVIADKTPIHPVRDWLNTLKWDRKTRLDTWLTRLAGAEDTPYTRAVAAMFMIGAVARVMQPGCKVDHTLIIEGKTGRGKSTLLRVLTGGPPGSTSDDWFLETEMDLGSKDFFQMLRGKWIIELAELDSLSRGDLSRVKAVLTKCVDTYRESYGRHRHDFPRQCVFTGTTEEDTYLRDEKGNRRFWPSACGEIDTKTAAKERTQLWAEAVFRFQKGEKWHITDRKLLGHFEQEQEWRRQHDPWEAVLATWLARSPRRQEKGVTTGDALTNALEIPRRDQGRLEQMRIGAILRKLGWERQQLRDTFSGDREYLYLPGPAALRRLQEMDAAKRTAEVKESEGKLTHLVDHVRGGTPKKKGFRRTRPKPSDE